jgi:LysM repeat protein
MVARNRGRYLAPIALAVAITATYLVVHATLGDKQTSAHSQAVIHSTSTATRTKPVNRARSYTVRHGDTLSGISAKTGVPLPTLETLNPNVNPNALQTGQRLRLRQ